jgi:hypothetical protein
MTAKYDITIEQGTDYELEFDWLDSDNLPIDITGYVFEFTVMSSDGRDTIIFNNPAAITLGGTTTFYAKIPKEVTSTMTRGNYVYFVDYINTLAIKKRLLQGRVTASLIREG